MDPREFPHSDEYSADLKALLDLPGELSQYHCLRNNLACALRIWLSFQDEIPYWEIGLMERRHSSLPPLNFYKGGPAYYTIFLDAIAPNLIAASKSSNPSFKKLPKQMQRALITENTCRDFCFVFNDIAHRLLQGMITPKIMKGGHNLTLI